MTDETTPEEEEEVEVVSAAENETEPEPEIVDIMFMRLNPNPLMHLPICVQGEFFTAILDTGSQINIVSEAALKRIGVSPSPLAAKIVLQLADGSTQKTRNGVTLRLSMGSSTADTKFAVVPSFPNDLLLGLDFMQSHDVVIRPRERLVWINGFKFLLPENQPTTRKSCLFTETEITIPGRSEIPVPLKRFVLTGDLVLCEGTETALTLGLLVAATLSRPEGQQVYVRIANPTNRPVRICAGSALAQAEDVDGDCVDNQGNETRVLMTATKETENETQPEIRSKRMLNAKDLDIGETLNKAERTKLWGLIDSYDDIMSKHESDTGLTDVMTHSINTGDAAPINQRTYRLSFSERTEVQKLVAEYAEAGYIRESDSPWACPIVIVRKKDGTMRFCCDWRKLNSVTRKDALPLPRIDDMMDKLRDAKFFTKLDLTSGYYQVPLDPESRENTAFVTPDGHYEWNVMGMGLTNAPATFQKLMYKVLGGLLWTNCMAYLDDIVVFSNSFDQHLEDLDNVFGRIRACKLKIKPPKCSFAKSGIHYLGFVITAKGVEVDPENTAKVEKFAKPENKKDVRSFVGMSSYYRLSLSRTTRTSQNHSMN